MAQTSAQPYPFSATAMEGGGKVSVGTAAVEVTFTMATKQIIITADPVNSGTLYVGNSNVTSAGANAITYLGPGDSIILDFDDTSVPVYVVASTSSQNFFKGALA